MRISQKNKTLRYLKSSINLKINVFNKGIKQGRVYEKYEKLCGIKNGGDRKSVGQIDRLITQEQIAKELGKYIKTLYTLFI